MAVIVGLVVGFIAVGVIEAVAYVMYPPPPGFDYSDSEALGEFVKTLPPTAFVIVLVAHAIGAFTAGLACSVVAKQRWRTGSIILGCVLTLAGVSNLVTIPHPIWFAAVDLLLYLPAALLGGRLAPDGKPVEPKN